MPARSPWKRWLAVCLTVFVATIVIYAGLLPWREERLVQRIQAGEPVSERDLALPFASKPGYAYASRALDALDGDLAEAERQIERSIKNRPLDANAWLLRAAIALRQGKKELAVQYTDTARRLWPNWSWTLWPAAMQYIQEGQNERAMEALQAYLRARPSEVSRVLVTASRLSDNPETLLDFVIPKDLPKDKEPDYYLSQALRYAISVKNGKLAQAAWSRVMPLSGDHRELGMSYLNSLVAQNDADLAAEVWYGLTGTQASEKITNGSFEKELFNGGFGWVTTPVKGAEISRTTDQAIDGRFSLQVSFDGTENVDFYHIYQTVPVKPGATYHISAYWRGEGITTRSNPYIDAYSIGAEKNAYARSEPKRKSWSWTKQEFEITVPDDARFIRVRLRRNRTEALDKLIAGTVWLDEVEIKPIVAAVQDH